MKKTGLSISLPKICLAMGLMLGPGAWSAYALPASAEAQQVKSESGTTRVSGTVVDENGEPIIGASVRVKGTDISTPTDIDGNFILPSLRSNQTIDITYVGYITKSLTVSELSNRGVKSPSNRAPKTSTKSSSSVTEHRKRSTLRVLFSR